MSRQWRRGALVVIALFVVASLAAGCADAESTPQTQRPHSAAKSSSSSAAPRVSSPAPPKQISDFPNGIYRTQLKAEDLQRYGIYDPTNAGIWTLTVENGGYRLDCRAISDVTVDCGNSHPDGLATVEMGDVRGASPTVWFLFDSAQVAEVNGCTRYSQESNGCGPEGGYHVKWTTAPGGVIFSHWVGFGQWATLPGVNNWTAQPWTRIS